jgi:hypothetical protein
MSRLRRGCAVGPRKRLSLGLVGWGMIPLVVTTGLCQTSPADGPWSGQAQCKITVQGPGYTHQETHTWTLSGGAPTVQGAMRIFSGTWSVSGQGSLTRAQGSQVLNAQWTTKGSASAPTAVFVRASDGRLIIKSWHAQLRQAGGVSGAQQVTINGIAQPQVPISLEAFEWAFPTVDTVKTNSTLSGSKSMATTGAVGPMQPGGSKGTAACNWNFVRAH